MAFSHKVYANTIQWNAVFTQVRINVKCNRGINQCNVTSDKIIEVRSNGMEVRSNGMEVRSNVMEVRSNGMKVAIRLHFFSTLYCHCIKRFP